MKDMLKVTLSLVVIFIAAGSDHRRERTRYVPGPVCGRGEGKGRSAEADGAYSDRSDQAGGHWICS